MEEEGRGRQAATGTGRGRKAGMFPKLEKQIWKAGLLAFRHCHWQPSGPVFVSCGTGG